MPLNRTELLKIALLGACGGLLSGLLGVSGGVVLVPALVLILGWHQKLAQGTALAVSLPPVGILAVMDYHRGGHVRLDAAVIMAVGVFLGCYVGGRVVQHLPAHRLRQGFGVLLLIIGLKMAFKL
jgi:uncharacterized membrane protein YfcA